MRLSEGKPFPNVICQGGGRKFIFRVIVDKKQLFALPKTYGLLAAPIGWLTATVVDFTPGAHSHDIYVVTD
jgi:hypothetical protein